MMPIVIHGRVGVSLNPATGRTHQLDKPDKPDKLDNPLQHLRRPDRVGLEVFQTVQTVDKGFGAGGDDVRIRAAS